jgi:hypothetical protein
LRFKGNSSGRLIEELAKLADGERRQAKLIVRRGAGGLLVSLNHCRCDFHANWSRLQTHPWQTSP